MLDFLRSVIPADPSQLLFLAGVVCLVVAHGLRWLPVEISPLPGQPTDSFARLMQTVRPFFVFPIIFAGAAGYFICFWPGAHPVRRILALVFLPTLASLGLLFSLFVHLNEPFSSVLESTGSAVSHRINGAQGMLWKLPQAFQFSLIGLLLIAIFTSRLAFGIATLPLALPERHGLQSEDFGSWRPLQVLLWFLVLHVFCTCITFLRNNRHSFSSYFTIALLRSKRLVWESSSYCGGRSSFWNRAMHYGGRGKADYTEFDTAARTEVVFACAGVSGVHRHSHFHGTVPISPRALGGT
jgi:hypothetical protein